MITDVLLTVIVSLLGAIFYFLPVVSVSSIPYIGTSIASTLTLMVTTWNAFMVTFPYAVVIWNTLLFVIIPFEFTMLVGKFFFGSRLPAHTN